MTSLPIFHLDFNGAPLMDSHNYHPYLRRVKWSHRLITQPEIIQVLQVAHLFAHIFHCVVFSIPCMCLLVQIRVLKELHFIAIQLAWKVMQLLI